MRYKYSDEDIVFLEEHYPDGHWDKIFERFPQLTKSCIHKKCHRIGIVSNNVHRKNFNITQTRTKWSNTEIQILIDNYSCSPLEDLAKLLPNRTLDMIKTKANTLGLLSYNKYTTMWREEELQYIINNWKLIPDKIMALHLNRTFRAVKAKREELGLYRKSFDSCSYETLSKYLRGQNQKWKNDSLKDCQYKCVLTGSKNFEIHHLYSVSNILNDIFTVYPNLKDKDFQDYSDKELKLLLTMFLDVQSQYPLGVCVDKKIHTLFHSMYGQYCNTPEQWYQFSKDYNNGVYQKYV